MKSKSFCVLIGIIMIFFVGRYCIFCTHSWLGTVSSCLLYPILRVQQLIVEPIRLWSGQRIAFQELQKAYGQLQEECKELQSKNISLNAVIHYINSTKELVDFKARYNIKNAVVAQVLARHLSEQNQFFLINAGTNKCIKKDMIALYNNCLIGRVVEVYPWYCKVCLITDSECNVAAFCSSCQATGILEGANSEIMLLRYVSHLKQVVQNDLILSSGEGLIFPKGFGLGTIINSVKGDLFYTIQVKPMIDLCSVQYCILVAKEQIENGEV